MHACVVEAASGKAVYVEFIDKMKRLGYASKNREERTSRFLF